MGSARRRAAAAAFAALMAAPSAAASDPVRVDATPVALDAAEPERTEAGDLRFRGGLALTSPDPRFGGISGFVVSADGSRFRAVTDIGYWLTGTLGHDTGQLVAVGDVAIAPLRDPEGNSVAGSKRRGDAEALAVMPDGSVLVAFERVHRIWRYRLDPADDAARAEPVIMPEALERARDNGGLEALAVLPSGTVLAVTEATLTVDGYIAGWRGTGADAEPLRLARIAPFDLTDLAVLPSGDLLTLERRYSPIGGVGFQLRRIPAATLAGGGPLEGDIVYRSRAGDTADNMEALAVRQTADGEIAVYVVSDDNFNPLQRTLVMMFALAPDAPR